MPERKPDKEDVRIYIKGGGKQKGAEDGVAVLRPDHQQCGHHCGAARPGRKERDAEGDRRKRRGGDKRKRRADGGKGKGEKARKDRREAATEGRRQAELPSRAEAGGTAQLASACSVVAAARTAPGTRDGTRAPRRLTTALAFSRWRTMPRVS